VTLLNQVVSELNSLLSRMPDNNSRIAYRLHTLDYDQLLLELEQLANVPEARLRGVYVLGVAIFCDDDAPPLSSLQRIENE